MAIHIWPMGYEFDTPSADCSSNVNFRLTNFFYILSLFRKTDCFILPVLPESDFYISHGKKKRYTVASAFQGFCLFLFSPFPHLMWCRVGDPGPHIHYHFKTCCSDQMAGKRKFNIRVLPWLKHLQHCDTNRLSEAKMNLDVYGIVCVCVCVWLFAFQGILASILYRSERMCVCTLKGGQNNQSLVEVPAVMSSRWGDGWVDRVTTRL